MAALVLVLTLTLTGCLDSRPRQESPQQPVQISIPKAEPDARVDGLGKSIGDMRSELQASSNANQNTITGLGANISKVAEKIQGFGGDLARIETSISTRIDNTIQAQASLKAELLAQIRADIKSEIQAQVTLNAQATAQLQTRIEALAQGQVGLNNSIQTMHQNISSGRDSVNQVVNFSETHRKALEDAYKYSHWTVIALCGVIVNIVLILSYRSRSRAEGRFAQLQDHFILRKGAQDHVQKA